MKWIPGRRRRRLMAQNSFFFFFLFLCVNSYSNTYHVSLLLMLNRYFGIVVSDDCGQSRPECQPFVSGDERALVSLRFGMALSGLQPKRLNAIVVIRWADYDQQRWWLIRCRPTAVRQAGGIRGQQRRRRRVAQQGTHVPRSHQLRPAVLPGPQFRSRWIHLSGEWTPASRSYRSPHRSR